MITVKSMIDNNNIITIIVPGLLYVIYVIILVIVILIIYIASIGPGYRSIRVVMIFLIIIASIVYSWFIAMNTKN